MNKDTEYSYNSIKKRLKTLVNGFVTKEVIGDNAKKLFAKLIEEKPESSKK